MARTRDRLVSAGAREHPHGIGLVLRAGFVHRRARESAHLQFRHARADVCKHMVERLFRDGARVAQAGDLILALDHAQLHDQFVAAHNLDIAKAFLERIRDLCVGDMGDQVVAGDGKALDVGAEPFEHIGNGLEHVARVLRVRAFAECREPANVRDARAVRRIGQALGSDQKHRVALLRKQNAAAFKRRPVVRQIPRELRLRLVSVGQKRVDSLFAHQGLGARRALSKFFVRYSGSAHTFHPFRCGLPIGSARRCRRHIPITKP